MIPVAYGKTAALDGPSQESGGIDPRLKPAAHQFEAIMIEQLLKPLEKDPLFSDKSDGAGLVTGDAGGSTWSSLGAESLARAISDAGGLGVATRVMQEVEAEARAEATAGPGAAKAAEGVGGKAPVMGSSAKSGSAQGGRLDAGGRGNEAQRHGWSPVRGLP